MTRLWLIVQRTHAGIAQATFGGLGQLVQQIPESRALVFFFVVFFFLIVVFVFLVGDGLHVSSSSCSGDRQVCLHPLRHATTGIPRQLRGQSGPLHCPLARQSKGVVRKATTQMHQHRQIHTRPEVAIGMAQSLCPCGHCLTLPCPQHRFHTASHP